MSSRDPSPISRLPSDILLYIFDFGTFLLDRPYDDCFPLHVSHVCRQWRRVALGSSILWSTILIEERRAVATSGMPPTPPIPRTPRESLELCISRVITFLERSAQCPLTISFDLTWVDWEIYDKPGPFMSFANEIRQHLGRCRSLTILSQEPSTIFNLLSTFHIAMPLLEQLKVINLATTNGVTPPDLADYSDNMYPRLREVALDAVNLMWSSVHLSNLHTLNINCLPANVRPTFSQLRYILLSNAHSLCVLDLMGGIPLVQDADQHIAREPIHLPHVVSLALGCDGPSDALALIRALRTPRLTTLHLAHFGGALEVDFTDVIEMLVAGTMCPPNKIEYLCLDYVTLNPTTDLLPYFLGPFTSDYQIPNLEAIIRAPLELYSSLTSLKGLSLECLDPSFVVALNLPMPSTELPMVFPVPTLEYLSLYDEVNILANFCYLRTYYAKLAKPSPYVIPLLRELAMDTYQTGAEGAEIWRDDINLDLVAEETWMSPYLAAFKIM
jgi:hypothetical protein